MKFWWCLVFTVLVAIAYNHSALGESTVPWKMHVIDNTSRGADGVRLGDINHDGLMDIVTPWEEGCEVKVYRNPGYKLAKNPWLAVTVGKVGSPEDAVFADIDDDGVFDVISASEGDVKSLQVSWAPSQKRDYFLSTLWKTRSIPAAEGMQKWMFSLPMQIDGKNGIDILAGGKEENAQIGWFQAPQNAHDLTRWQWHPLYSVGWIMSLVSVDIDRDGDLDIVGSDRKGTNSGCFWIENPGKDRVLEQQWLFHPIGDRQKEVMFLDVVDFDGDNLLDILVATRGKEILFHHQQGNNADSWKTFIVQIPPDTAGTAKAVKVGDINLDGKLDIVFTCENAQDKSGVMWLSYENDIYQPNWSAHDISGPKGIKYDLVHLIDLDGDGDLDVVTCEEAEKTEETSYLGLGVIWYENPTRHKWWWCAIIDIFTKFK
ncbi:MAG: VCBS repeat-containing protein [Okeania sp. SIO3B5]|uniref:FG-GAP repeat domain-containing protein n=1 Tax=Okeania sp. SIO3B5 TaxID=2607811 RepID=UPI0013FEF9CC|nr:VCBS repeat-containing protein [Okeania sp. SIO3B5]NEO57000.1 VCBS repeat-containing protein [Okeania sp. SIO3B5]